MHYAAKACNAKLLFWLIQNGADINLLSKADQMTPLMYAAKYSYGETQTQRV